MAPEEVTIDTVASKWLSASMIREEFDRAFNEVFEDLLIRRWRGPARVRNFGKAQVVEDDKAYRVKIVLPDADPRQLEVEVGAWRLAVRIPTAQGREENTFDFSHRVDMELVTARFEAGILEVLVPKARGGKIEVR
jgi:HSP20 family molecular chaperone IbpA